MITFRRILMILFEFAWDFEYRYRFELTEISDVMNRDREAFIHVLRLLEGLDAVVVIDDGETLTVHMTERGKDLMKQVDEFRRGCGLDL